MSEPTTNRTKNSQAQNTVPLSCSSNRTGAALRAVNDKRLIPKRKEVITIHRKKEDNTMKNPSKEVLAQAVKLKKDGKPWHEVLSITGLSHSQAEIAYFKATLPKDQFHPYSVEKVVELRNQGVSWGIIGVRLSVPESTVRSAYKEATGTLSEGQRIGRGGRWLNNDQELYRDVLQPTGTVIPKEYGRKFAPIAAAQQRLLKMSVEDLRQLAKDNGINPKGKTPAQIIRLLVEKFGLTVPGVDDVKGKGNKATKAAAPKKAATPKATAKKAAKQIAKVEAPKELPAPPAEDATVINPDVLDQVADDLEKIAEDMVIQPFTIGEKVGENDEVNA